MESEFRIDGLAFALALLLLISFAIASAWRRRLPAPHLRFPSIKSIAEGKKSWKTRWSRLPRRLKVAALWSFMAAFVDPHLIVPHIPQNSELPDDQGEDGKKSLAVEGIGIYLVLDQSSSMKETLVAIDSNGNNVNVSKMDLLKKVARQFVEGDSAQGLRGRWNDMIGLVAFARVPHVLSPLTLDHELLVKNLLSIEAVKDPAKDGTGIGYAIFKTANLIAATKYFSQQLVKEGKPSYDMKSTIIVLVTDGIQTPNPRDSQNELRVMSVPDAADYAKKEGIRLYIINVEPAILRPEYNFDRKQLQEAAEETHGRFYIADAQNPLQQVFHEIDTLEKSRVPTGLDIEGEEGQKIHDDEKSGYWRRVSFHPYLIAMGMLLLAFSFILDTTFMKRVP